MEVDSIPESFAVAIPVRDVLEHLDNGVETLGRGVGDRCFCGKDDAAEVSLDHASDCLDGLELRAVAQPYHFIHCDSSASLGAWSQTSIAASLIDHARAVLRVLLRSASKLHHCLSLIERSGL